MMFLDKNCEYVDMQAIKKETAEDVTLQKVKLFINEGWPRTSKNLSDELRPYFGVSGDIYVENDVMMMGHRVIVPEKLRLTVLKEMHAAHLGINKTKDVARSYVWWPNMGVQIENLVKSCRSCYGELQDPPKIEIKEWPESKFTWERVHMDFLGPMNGHHYFVIIDSYSKWPEVFKMNDIRTSTTIDKLRETFGRYGLPKTMVSDNGPQFTAQEFQEFLQRNQVKHITTPVYHPQSNGQAENFVKTFKSGLKKNIEAGSSIDLAMSQFLLAYPTTPHATTRKTPAELFLGRKMRLRFDNMLESNKPEQEDGVVKQSRRKGFEVGDDVIVRNYSTTTNEKWMEGTVTRKIGRWLYGVDVQGKLIKRHANQMRGYVKVGKPAVQVRTDEMVEYENGHYPIMPRESDSVVEAEVQEQVAAEETQVREQPTGNSNSDEASSRPRRDIRLPVRFHDYEL